MKTPVKSHQNNFKITSADIVSNIQKIEEEFDDFLQYLDPPDNLNSALNSARSNFPTMHDRSNFQLNFALYTKRKVTQTDAVFNDLITACSFTLLDIREVKDKEDWQQALIFLIKMAQLLGRLEMCQLFKTSTLRKTITSTAGKKKNDQRSTLANLLIAMFEAQVGNRKYKSVDELMQSIDSKIAEKLLSDFTISCQQCGSSYPAPLDENLPRVIKKMMKDSPDFDKRMSVFLGKNNATWLSPLSANP